MSANKRNSADNAEENHNTKSVWKEYMDEISSSALKLNHKHASSSNCNIMCARNSFEVTQYKNLLPFPLSQSKTVKFIDPIVDLVHKKRKFHLAIDDVKKSFKKNQRLLNVKKQFKCYEDMQMVLKSDPDKYFCSNYNWYYTGGNLRIENVDGNNLLFYVLNNEIAFGDLKRKTLHWKMKFKESIANNFNSEIYQLDTFNKNNLLLLSARTKNNIFLYDININDDNILSKEIDTLTDRTRLVSHSINKHNGTEYCTANALQVLNLWDIPTKTQKFSYKINNNLETSFDDHFAQIIYHDNNTLLYVNREEFYLYDIRTNFESNLFIKNSDVISPIDKFTNICSSEINNYLYMSSFRNILQMDIRYLSIINKWYHTFHSPPLISNFVNIDNQNIFSASSTNPDEKIVINNNNLPNYLPNCNESFELALIHNPKFNKQEDILKRLKISTTGFQTIVEDNKATIISANAFGDLFSQDILRTQNENIDINKINKKFLKWNDTLFKESLKKCNYEEIRVIDKVVLDNIQIKHKKPPEIEDKEKSSLLKSCLTDLKLRKKGFNNKITDIWFDVADNMVLDELEQLPPDDNISNWLNTQVQNEDDVL